jgi:zinc transporter 2
MDKETRLKLAILLSGFFMLIEVFGGYLANSLAIFSDAAHLLTDIAGFAIALLATIASKSKATKRLTFGLARAEVFGALFSVLSLWLITFYLLYEAYCRAYLWFSGRPEEVNGRLMFIVACFGVGVNLCLGKVFHEEHGGGLHPGHSHEHHHHHSSSEGGDHGHSGGGGGGGGHEHSHGHGAPCSGHSAGQNNHGKEETEEGSYGSYQNIDFVADVESGDDHEAQEHAGHDHDHGHRDSHSHCDHDHESGSHKQKPSGKPSKQPQQSSCSGHDHEHGNANRSFHSSLTPSPIPTEETRLLADDHHGHGHGHSSSDNEEDEEESHSAHHVLHGDSHDVNMEAAYMHVITDLIQSIGVAIAGMIMWKYPHCEIIDPICTLLFGCVALYTTIPLLTRVFYILFEGTPTQIDWETVMEKFADIPGVENVHDLHIWSISSTSISLTCHIRVSFSYFLFFWGLSKIFFYSK